MSQPETSPTANTSHISRIARAATLVMILFIASRTLGLLREIIIARQFGTSAEMDAYLAAFRLPDFLFYLVAGGALGSAFIPVFSGYLTRADMSGGWRLASAVINWVVLVLSALGVVAAIFAPWLVQTLFGDLTLGQQTLTTELMRWMLISTVIFGVSGVVMGILNAQQHFLLPALAPVIYNLAIILGAWFLGPTWGVRGLTVGVVLGAVAHLLVQIPALIWGRARMQYRPVFSTSDNSLYEVGRLMAPRVLGLAAVQINFLVNTILAASLAVGSLTALNYAWIIMLLPQGVISQSVATALFPTLATLSAQQEWAEIRRVFGLTLRGMLFLTLPATAGLIILAKPIVRLLLERGQFTAESTQATALPLALFSLGLVSHALVEITTRAFYALKNTKTPVGIGIAAMLLNVALSLLLMRVFAQQHWPPHGGLALANTIAVTLEMVVLLLLLRKPLGALALPGLGQALLKMALATVGMALALLLFAPFLPPNNLGTIGGIIIGGGVYLVLAYLAGVDELKIVQQKILRRVRR